MIRTKTLKLITKATLCFILILLTPAPLMVLGQSPVVGSTTSSSVPANFPINTRLPIPNEVPISGFEGEGPGQGPAAIVANLYSFSFLMAGFLAFAMSVYAGVRWTFSGGNTSAIKESKDTLTDVGSGLALLLFAYLILTTINPDLTTLNLPGLSRYTPPEPVAPTVPLPPGPGPGTEDLDPDCPLPGLTILTDPITIELENAARERRNTSIYNSSHSGVQMNLDHLKEQIDKAQEALATDFPNVSMKVNSAYRTIAYQRHFHEIHTKYKNLQADAALRASCPNLTSKVLREKAMHGIADKVAEPTGCAPHVRGIGVDIKLTGITETDAEYLFRSLRIDLHWRALSGDRFHFQTNNPPYEECGE